MKRKYMVKDKPGRPGSASHACGVLRVPWVYVSAPGECGEDVYLTEPSRQVINALEADGFEVLNARGERCVPEEAPC